MYASSVHRPFSERTMKPDSIRSSVLLPSVPLLAVLLAASCMGTSQGERSVTASAEDDEKAPDAAEIGVAEMELELARLEAEQEIALAELGVVNSRHEADRTGYAKDAFNGEGMAIKLDEAKLALDRAKGRATDAEAELAELEAMYKEEEFAEKTKELVLMRGRRNLEHARRDVELAERNLTQLQQHGLPNEARQLEYAALQAKKDLTGAEQGLVKLKLEKKIAVAKAEKELTDLRKKGEKEDEDGKNEEGEKEAKP